MIAMSDLHELHCALDDASRGRRVRPGQGAITTYLTHEAGCTCPAGVADPVGLLSQGRADLPV